jgi:uncharacterized protein (TIGR03435 family)
MWGRLPTGGGLANPPVFFLMIGLSVGQSQPKQEFEVASVKPAAPFTGKILPRNGPGSADPGRINYISLTLKTKIMTAKFGRIKGPDWIDSNRYDILATLPPGTAKEQVNVMLQNLLADRFKLALHRETKELPMYELVVGKNSSKLKPYVEDHNAPKPAPSQFVATGKDGVPIPPPGGLMMTMSTGRRRVLASKQSLSKLVDMLAAELGRPVLDKTGLARGGPPPDIIVNEPGPADSDAPSLVAAVQDQLRLEPKKGPIEMLVIDHAEKSPTEN